jgi:hypothetical protein
MIAQLIKFSLLRLYLFSTTLLLLSIFLYAKPLVAAALPDSISWLWQPPPDRTQVELRLTSVDSACKRQMAQVVLDYFHKEDSLKLMVWVKAKDQKGFNFCFRCDESNSWTPCDIKEGIKPDSMEALIPGTQLSWLALTSGFCRRFEARKNMRLSDALTDIFDVQPLDKINQVQEFKLRVFVSKATKLPERITYMNRTGRELSNIDIHEIRNTLWGRVITRSIFHNPETHARVLIEVRSGTIGMLPEVEGR